MSLFAPYLVLGLRNFLFILLCLSSVCYDTIAQTNTYVPDAYQYFSQNYVLLNPSYIPEKGAYDFTVSHKFLAGQFKDISNTNFVASKNIRDEKKLQALRLLVGREQEGPYITVPRFGLSYGYALKVKSNLSLCSGIMLGSSGLYLSAPSVSSSYFLPDGSVGLGMRYKTLYVGASALQIFNASRPSFGLKRYYNMIVSHHWARGLHWVLKNETMASFVPGLSPELKYAFSLSYNESVDIGLVLRSKAGISYVASFVLPMKEDRLRLSFAYNTNWIRHNYFISNSMELMVGLVLE